MSVIDYEMPMFVFLHVSQCAFDTGDDVFVAIFFSDVRSRVMRYLCNWSKQLYFCTSSVLQGKVKKCICSIYFSTDLTL